jgi:hypothetical protein
VLALLVALGAGLAVAQEDLVERFQTLTRGTQWQQVSAELVDFQTFHTQRMTRVGEAFFVSSVEIVTPTERYPELRDGYDRTGRRCRPPLQVRPSRQAARLGHARRG